ncbi:MAG: flagellar export protein FliJ [Syntrophomonadaceae bacterium]|nr:flagellar export protein FliJ [Syntrophomonadaceae bacterium]
MSKFTFQLESALRYRQNIEEQEAARLAQARQKVLAEENTAFKLKQEKQSHLRTYNPPRVSLTAMQQQEAYVSWLDRRIKEQQQKVELARQNFGVQRHRVVEAATKRKSLETLKERSWKEYKAVIAKSEQIILDDIGISAYCHKSRN